MLSGRNLATPGDGKTQVAMAAPRRGQGALSLSQQRSSENTRAPQAAEGTQCPAQLGRQRLGAAAARAALATKRAYCWK